MKRKLTSLKAFARWLRKQPVDTQYPYPPSECCPLARYTGDGFPGDGHNPKWAVDFMCAFDKLCMPGVLPGSQVVALKALALVESSHSAEGSRSE